MVTKRKPTKKNTKRAAGVPVPVRKSLEAAARATSERLRGAWDETVAVLAAAPHRLERQVEGLLKKNRLGRKDAAALLRELRQRTERERKKATKELQAGLARFQTRVEHERKSLGRTVEHGVRSALAAFDIPSRREVSFLTTKVQELSRKIDRLKR